MLMSLTKKSSNAFIKRRIKGLSLSQSYYKMLFSAVLSTWTRSVINHGLGTSWDPLWHQIECGADHPTHNLAPVQAQTRPFLWQKQGDDRRQDTQLVEVNCVNAVMETHMHKTRLAADKHFNCPCSEALPTNAYRPEKKQQKMNRKQLGSHSSREAPKLFI